VLQGIVLVNEILCALFVHTHISQDSAASFSFTLSISVSSSWIGNFFFFLGRFRGLLLGRIGSGGIQKAARGTSTPRSRSFKVIRCNPGLTVAVSRNRTFFCKTIILLSDTARVNGEVRLTLKIGSDFWRIIVLEGGSLRLRIDIVKN